MFSIKIDEAACEALKAGVIGFNAVERACIKVENRAQQLCPVDTGRLRNSITHTISEGGPEGVIGTVGSNVEYAIYVELGTYKMGAEPYLRPAMLDVLGVKNVKSVPVVGSSAGGMSRRGMDARQ